MSNKIVYSCDSSDEGSDMDVSDSDDGARLYTQAQQSNTGRHVKTAAFRVSILFYALVTTMKI
jgi:hypothetical protein